MGKGDTVVGRPSFKTGSEWLNSCGCVFLASFDCRDTLACFLRLGRFDAICIMYVYKYIYIIISDHVADRVDITMY